MTSGFLIGISVCIFIFLVEIYLASRGKQIVNTFEKVVNRKIAPKGAVLQPKSEFEINAREILEKNEREGKDTPIEDIL